MNRNFVFLSFWCFVCDACRYKFLAKNFFMRKEATTKGSLFSEGILTFVPLPKKSEKSGLTTLFQTQVFSLGTIFFGSDSSRIKREASNSPHLYASTLLGAITRSDLTLRYVLYKVESDPKKCGKIQTICLSRQAAGPFNRTWKIL